MTATLDDMLHHWGAEFPVLDQKHVVIVLQLSSVSSIPTVHGVTGANLCMGYKEMGEEVGSDSS